MKQQRELVSDDRWAVLLLIKDRWLHFWFRWLGRQYGWEEEETEDGVLVYTHLKSGRFVAMAPKENK